MNEGWEQDRGLAHVIAYSENAAEKRYVAGVLDDYAFLVDALIDAWYATGNRTVLRLGNRDWREHDCTLL